MIWLAWLGGAILMIFALPALIGAPYVPSRSREVQRLFAEALPLGKGDVVLDIGSGDGVVLMAAAQQGARAIGYEINPFLVLISRWRLRKLPGAQVHWANIWRQPVLEKVTVMYTFGDGRDIAKMFQLAERQAAAQTEPLTFVSYGFAVPGVRQAKEYHGYFLYRLPGGFTSPEA